MQALPEGGDGKAEDGYLDVVTAAEPSGDIILHGSNCTKDSRAGGREARFCFNLVNKQGEPPVSGSIPAAATL